MLFLLVFLFVALGVFLIGYWSMHIFPAPRPFRYNSSSEVRVPEARKTSLHVTLLNQYQLQGRLQEALTDSERIYAIVTWVHSLWSPEAKSARSDNTLAIISRAKKGERFRRDDYVTVIADALMAVDIPARIVSLCTRDTGFRPFHSMYRGIEYFDRDHLKWAWLDARFGIRVVKGFTPLNAIEIKDAILHQELVDLDNNAQLDADQYLTMLTPYLDILISRPIGQTKKIALVPPQLKFWKHKWLIGEKLFDMRCQSLKTYYVSHPIKQLVAPNWRRNIAIADRQQTLASTNTPHC